MIENADHEIGRLLDGLSVPPDADDAVFAAALAFMEIRLDRPLSSLPLVRAMMQAKTYA